MCKKTIQSEGHKGFHRYTADGPVYELFEVDGIVYRAPIERDLDPKDGCRKGRDAQAYIGIYPDHWELFLKALGGRLNGGEPGSQTGN
jgi:hypothetical protein